MSKHKDSPEQVQAAHEWLDEAAKVLGLDPAIIKSVAADLLKLTREVAHNRSRPAAPLTSFLIGLSVGSRHAGADRDRIAQDVESLTNTLINRIHSED